LCDPTRLISFELTFTILQGCLNFNVADVTSNVADVTLCESSPSIEGKSVFLYGSQSYKARKAYMLCHFECNWFVVHVKSLKYHYTTWGTHHALYTKYKLHSSLLFPFLAWEFMLLTRIITSLSREWRKMTVFFSIQGFFTELAQLLIIGLDKGKQKGPLSTHFFVFLILFLTFSVDHLKFQSNWLWKKLLKVKAYIKRFKNC